MNKLIFFLSLIIIVLLSFSFSKNDNFSLTIDVNALRSSQGVVLFLLYNEEGSIPDKHRTKYYKKLSANIAGESATITFKNLPQGNYAVNIIHDENNNGKIDMGLLKPKEGIGFSNFKKINLMNRPSFSKASFKLNTDLNVIVKTIYM